MDRLISLEPSNLVPIRVEPGQRCYGELTLRNVMYTMPVAFRLQPMNKIRYTIRPQTGIISPLSSITVEITYMLPPSSTLPDSFPRSDDSFLLHSVVVPGATIKDSSSTFDSVPNDWFTTKKKQVFIDSGIKVIFVGSPILAQLVSNGSMEEVREVLERSDSAWHPADSVDSHGQPLLHLAIGQSRADLVQLILEFEPNIEARSRSGHSALEAAVAAGEALIVELLLARRVGTDQSESSNYGPIHLAAQRGHLEILRLLLLKGADFDSLTSDGLTALHLTVAEHKRDCAKLLLASGARTDIGSVPDGETPLHLAAGLGDEQMVKLLLQKGANKYILNRFGKTAYDIAVKSGHNRLFDVLGLGDRLCAAARKGELRAIHRILEKGTLINGRDQHGWTALHRAAFKGQVDAVRMLLDKGADIDARDEDGYTALHCASESGQGEVIELLVKKGADVEAQTNKGVTALHIAESLHYSGITRILMQGGANKDENNLRIGAPFWLSREVRDMDNGVVNIKKKPSRGRSLRGSLDRFMPLAVL
ncbi:MSP domain [Macleaya cordata]|uniref:MSP domain n=1 Tax=Macleaya cordata TaxID=56857 RepID=A0A200R150_MACCD|nr:MSP domain [Macleaya cordata]